MLTTRLTFGWWGGFLRASRRRMPTLQPTTRALSIRRAFDVGSGGIKCQVAEVDSGESSKILRSLYEDTRPHLFRPRGTGDTISDAASDAGEAIIEELLAATDHLGVEQSAGIATQAFRATTNGLSVIHGYSTRTGVPIKVVTPEEEGRLSHLNATSLAGPIAQPNELVSLDCGAGSLQVSSGTATHFEPQGSGTISHVAHEIAAALRAEGSTGSTARGALVNRLLAHVRQTMLPAPAWLQDLPCPVYHAVGSAQSIFNQQRVLGGSADFTQDDVRAVLADVLILDDSQLMELERERGTKFAYTASEENLRYILPKLVLLLGVMESLGVDRITFHQTHGNCAGLLLLHDLWSASETAAQPGQHTSKTVAKLKSPIEGGGVAGDREDCGGRFDLLTVNWHLEKDCNYKCKFCYAHFADIPRGLDADAGVRMLDALKDFGVYKINFAGGEPLLNRHLGHFLKHSHAVGLKTSIITNASRLTMGWLREHCRYIDQIGISCDSLDDAVNKGLGRGFGQHVMVTQRALDRVHRVNREEKDSDIRVKLNTVVMQQNHREDWSEFIISNRIDRWKVFKVLRIEGENEQFFDTHQSEFTDADFEAFVRRHAHLVAAVPETNDAMTSSYVMVTPDGRFYQNTAGKYSYSKPILDVGVEEALSHVQFDYAKFRDRGGAYTLNR